MKNTELAYATLDYIREHPEEWDQSYFFSNCGTVACFAGRAILIAKEWKNGSQYYDYCRKHITVVTASFAAELLGWTYDEAIHVFDNMTEDFEVLEQAVKEVLNGEVK